MRTSLKLIPFKFQESLFFDSRQVLLLHLLNALHHLVLLLLDGLDLACDTQLFAVDTILVMLVEVAFFP